MLNQFSPRDKRAIVVTCVAMVVILFYVVVYDPWMADWDRVSAEIKSKESVAKLLDATSTKAKQRFASFNEMIPAYAPPEKVETQRLLFEGKLVEQFKKAGLKPISMVFSTPKYVSAIGYYKLSFQMKCQCKFKQVFDLLATLRENPYLVGIEALDIKLDSKDRSKVDFTLKLSTYAVKG